MIRYRLNVTIEKWVVVLWLNGHGWVACVINIFLLMLTSEECSPRSPIVNAMFYNFADLQMTLTLYYAVCK